MLSFIKIAIKTVMLVVIHPKRLRKKIVKMNHLKNLSQRKKTVNLKMLTQSVLKSQRKLLRKEERLLVVAVQLSLSRKEIANQRTSVVSQLQIQTTMTRQVLHHLKSLLPPQNLLKKRSVRREQAAAAPLNLFARSQKIRRSADANQKAVMRRVSIHANA